MAYNADFRGWHGHCTLEPTAGDWTPHYSESVSQEEDRGGGGRERGRMNMIRLYYAHLQTCLSEAHYV